MTFRDFRAPVGTRMAASVKSGSGESDVVPDERLGRAVPDGRSRESHDLGGRGPGRRAGTGAGPGAVL